METITEGTNKYANDKEHRKMVIEKRKISYANLKSTTNFSENIKKLSKSHLKVLCMYVVFVSSCFIGKLLKLVEIHQMVFWNCVSYIYILMNAWKCAKKIVTLQNADESFLFAMHATVTIIKYHPNQVSTKWLWKHKAKTWDLLIGLNNHLVAKFWPFQKVITIKNSKRRLLLFAQTKFYNP